MSGVPSVLVMHWIEQLNQDHEVVRVLTDGKAYVARVVAHGPRAWSIERREAEGDGAMKWRPVRGNPRGFYHVRCVRSWRSPQAAMRVAEELFK